MAESTVAENFQTALNVFQKEIDKLSTEIQKISDKEKDHGYLIATVDKNVQRMEKSLETLQGQLESLKKDMIEGDKSIREELKDDYINKDKFEPVKLIVYGIAGAALTAVLVALLALVI